MHEVLVILRIRGLCEEQPSVCDSIDDCNMLLHHESHGFASIKRATYGDLAAFKLGRLLKNSPDVDLPGLLSNQFIPEQLKQEEEK